MKRLRILGLGTKLATAGGRAAWIRLGLTAAGFAIGSALLLSAASIVPGVHATDVRRDQLEGREGGRRAEDALRVWGMTQSFDDVDVSTSVVKPIGDAPIPPGLPRVPGPGEILISDGLASMWVDLRPQIEQRMHGHLAGTIAPDGVIGPDTLKMWEGKPIGVRLQPSAAYVQRSFGSVDAAPEPLPLVALLAVVVVASALLLPIWLFVATVTRLSAATRDARLAAVRLAGETDAQVRLLASAEAGVAAALGTWLGVPLFLAIRPFLADGAIAGIHMYPSDLAPPMALAAAMLLGLPAFAVLMSLLTMRRIVVSPLGVTRPTSRSHAGWRWLVVLGVGVGLLGWSATQHEALKRFGDGKVVVVVWFSVACIAFGLVGSASWSAWAIAHRLAGVVRSVPAMLGLRRLDAEPSSISRVVGGVAVMIALVGVVQSGLLSVERSEGSPAPPMEAMVLTDESDVVVFEGYAGTSSIDLADIPGVRSVRWTHKIPFGRVGSPIGILETDGNPGTLEAIRNRLAWSGAQVHTLSQLEARASLANDDYSSVRSGAMAITLFLLLVCAATLLVAMIDWLMERRRSLAVLSAVGVANASVRRSIVVQVGLSLTTSLMFGVAGAVVVTFLLWTALSQPVVFVVPQLATLTGAVIVVVLGITLATAPWLRISRRPELLREA